MERADLDAARSIDQVFEEQLHQPKPMSGEEE